MASAVDKYAFVNALLHARISKMLPQEFFDQLIRTRSLVEAMQLLRETPFNYIEGAYSKTGDIKTAELEFLKHEIAANAKLSKYVRSPESDFVKSLALQYEIDNLKNALRLWFDQSVRKRNIQDSVGYLIRERIVTPINIDAIINADSADSVLEALRRTQYEKVLAEPLKSVERNKSLFAVEIALDSFYYQQILHAQRKLNSRDQSIVKRLLGVEIDLNNISWIIRLKRFYKIPFENFVGFLSAGGQYFNFKELADIYAADEYGDALAPIIKKHYPTLAPLFSLHISDKYAQLILIERILDQIMMVEVRRMKAGFPFTIGIVLSYMLLAKNEVRKIVSILNAKHFDISQERIVNII